MSLRKEGFTLLETLIAMLILSTGIILLTNSWGSSFLRLRKAKMNHEVSILLQRKIAEVELEYRDKALDEIPEEKAEDFGSDYPDYSWKLQSKEFQMPDLSGALTGREGGADEMTMLIIKTLTEYLQKAIKEVKVTVLVKGPKTPLEFSVTTYFVDYNKPMPLPEIPGMGGGLPGQQSDPQTGQKK